MLAPFWAQLKLGPWLRRESDNRLYFDLFQARQGDIAGARKLRISLMGRREPEPDDLEGAIEDRHGRSLRPRIVTFRDARDEFHKLNGWDELLRNELRAITRPRWLTLAERGDLPAVGMHVRRGDFKEPISTEALRQHGLLRTPLAWFAAALQVLRRELGEPLEAFVVSDGAEEDLQELLALDGVELVRTGSAISDLLLLARSRVLLASVSSSFSAWASFLGQMPTLSHAGPSWEIYGIENKFGYHVGGFDPSRPSPEALVHVRRATSRVPLPDS